MRAPDEKAIRDGEVAWSSDWATRDVDKMSSHYADDATLMIPDMPVIKGRDALKPGLTGVAHG